MRGLISPHTRGEAISSLENTSTCPMPIPRSSSFTVSLCSISRPLRSFFPYRYFCRPRIPAVTASPSRYSTGNAFDKALEEKKASEFMTP